MTTILPKIMNGVVIWAMTNQAMVPSFTDGVIFKLPDAPTTLKYGQKLGVDLEGNPDLALDPIVAAGVLAHYFS